MLSRNSTAQVAGYFILILLIKCGYHSLRDQRRRLAEVFPSSAVQSNTVECLRDQNPQVKYGDWIYLKGDWDGSPIVLEEYKLVFFTAAKVGCTTFKMLFRRMMGFADWQVEEYERMLPWNPETNGLKYLYDYDRDRATEIMTSSEWTRAIFVRDPKERFLSAYLDKAVTNQNYMQICCNYKGECMQQARQSLQGFFEIVRYCNDAHWRQQSRRVDAQFWPFINFVGHMESIAEDTELLLKQIGAWDQFGKQGWGENSDAPIFGQKAGGAGRQHATNARAKLREFMTPELEIAVDDFYADDYSNPILGLNKTVVFGLN